METKKISKRAIIILSICGFIIIIAGVFAFLFIPRKSNQPLLQNTQKAFEAYPNMQIEENYLTFPTRGLKPYLDLNKKTYGGNNAYERKYLALYKRGGLYTTLSYAECIELAFSMSDDSDVALNEWKTFEDSRYFEVYFDGTAPAYSARKSAPI